MRRCHADTGGLQHFLIRIGTFTDRDDRASMTEGRRNDIINGRRLFRCFLPEFVKSPVERRIDMAPLGILERQDESLGPLHIPRQ